MAAEKIIMYSSWVIFYSICPAVSSNDVALPGHLMPLGSHQAADTIAFVDGFPQPEQFFDMFDKNSKAVVFRGACKDFTATRMWSDEFLRNEYGQLQVSVDKVKEENRYLPSMKMKIKDFLEAYHNASWYMIDTLPKEMWHDLDIPLSIRCGGYLKRLQDIVIWFSNKGSKSHLHLDTVENINCMIAGRKDWFLVNLENSKNIVMDHDEGDYCSVDVEKVDMIKYPFLRKIPWYNVSLEQGDCIYVPHGWAHQVSSQSERNIAINFWWTSMDTFNYSSCSDGSLKSIVDLNFTPGEQYRFQLLQLLTSTKEPCSFQCLHSNIVSEHTGKKLISREDFNGIDSNNNGLIERDEILQLSLETLENIFDGEEPGAVNIRGKFSSSPPEQAVHSKDEL